MELVCVVLVGTARIALIHGPAHPLLIPPDFVHAVVMAAAVSDGNAVEVVVIQQRPHGILATCAAAVNAHARQVHP